MGQLTEFFASFFIGLTTGLFSGCFGVGGGIICTPLLRMFLGFEPHEAVGTTLALIVPTSFSGALGYYRQNLADLKLLKMFVVPAVLATIGGAWATNYVKGSQLMLAFSALIAFSGLDLMLSLSQSLKERARVKHQAVFEKNAFLSGEGQDKADSWLVGLLVGALTGLMSGFFGVGGGFILIPILLGYYNRPVKIAFGTSLLLVATISIPGAVSHGFSGHVRYLSVLFMALGAIPGAMLGARLALLLKDNFLRRAFGALMLIIAVMISMRELGII